MKMQKLQRIFILKRKDDKDSLRLPDPNSLLNAEEVLDHYSAEYPELQNAFVTTGVQVGDFMEFEIQDNFGEKG